MRGSARVPPEHPVLRPLGTNNFVLQQVAKQPQMLKCTANPSEVSRLCVIPYLWTATPRMVLCPRCVLVLTCCIRCRWVELPSTHWLARANRWGKTSWLTMYGLCWTNGGKDATNWLLNNLLEHEVTCTVYNLHVRPDYIYNISNLFIKQGWGKGMWSNKSFSYKRNM